MEREVAIAMLEDIEQSLNDKDWKNKSLKTIDLYKKNLEIAENKKLKKLIYKQKAYVKKYGEDDKRTVQLNKKIDNEMRRIFDS